MADRQVFVDAAKAIVGLGASPKNPDTRQAYLDLIAPGETDKNKINSMATMSGCGLVVAGIWRAAGVQDPHLTSPYIIGTAVSRLSVLAHSCGAWTNWSADDFPDLGDAVLVGDNGAGGVEHIYTVTYSSYEGTALSSVDGGQRDPNGFQTILAKNRLWKGQKDIAYLGTDPGSNINGRKIIGWIDCTKLPT